MSDLAALGPHDSKEEVLGDLSWLRTHRSEFDVLALGIGTPSSRLRVAGELEPHFGPEAWPALVDPRARFDQASCQIGHGALVCAGVTATVHVTLEPFALLNLLVTVGHEARIGRGSVLNPSVNISGGVEIGEGVLIGTGAQVLQYLRVGAGATIGAGAVVTREVEPGVTVVGAPAKPLVRKGTP